MPEQPEFVYVDHLPDLITPDDYEVCHERKTVRIRLSVTEEGLEILGDSPYPQLLEELLAALGLEAVEMMLCG